MSDSPNASASTLDAPPGDEPTIGESSGVSDLDLAGDDPQFECTACGAETTAATGRAHPLQCACGGFLKRR